ncbi:MAG: iron-containing redox enzyme family protein [Nitrosopumilus sp.]|nr:iron-containing redox enzyme family protein [Nitrosopumilus sp.]
MGIAERIDRIVEGKSLLKHPFYRDWSDGKLSLESLAGYSMEYYQLVKAVPLMMDPIIRAAPTGARAELEENRQEEADHVAPWEAFAGGLGVSAADLADYTGLEKTRRAVSDLVGLAGEGPAEGAAAMYALELEIPKISATKLEGLSEFYGITSAAATEYFELHMEADVRHAASWRGLLRDGTEGAAERSMDAQNLLLDACYEEYCS